MQQMRCVFVTVPPLLSAIITNTLSRRVDLQVLGKKGSRESVPEWLATVAPDLLILGITPGESTAIGTELLQLLPRGGKVLVIRDTGDLAVLCEMRPHCSVLSDFSPDKLLTFVFGPDTSSPRD
jgi:DNA-binding NarL/FixJ family response regulator